MTERQWLECGEPARMLNHLGVDQNWGMVEITANCWAPSRKKHKLDNPLQNEEEEKATQCDLLRDFVKYVPA